MPMTFVAHVSPGLGMGRSHDGLGRQVKHIVGPRRRQGRPDRARVPQVPLRVLEARREAQLPEKRRLRGRRQAETLDLRPEPEKPFTEPGALEARMPGDKDPPALEGFEECCHQTSNQCLTQRAQSRQAASFEPPAEPPVRVDVDPLSVRSLS